MFMHQHQARHFSCLAPLRLAYIYIYIYRLCKEIGADAELMNLALKSNSALMVQVARYFEKINNLDKAVQLYHKG
jgi:hypothetical protein